MKLCDFATDQQMAVFAILIICVMAVVSGIEGSKDILLTLGGAIAGWMSKSQTVV